MPEYANRAAQALSVYLERGKKALECLRVGEIDQAVELLRLRGAAFYNFRALEAKAREVGSDMGGGETVVAMLAEDDALRGQLVQALAETLKKTGKQLAKIRDARQTLSSYRSKAGETTRFEKSV
jgi:hypothetical protein